MKLVAATLLILVAASRPADACGVPDIGMMLADVVKTFETKRTPVHKPMLVIGGGVTTEGTMPSIAAGYAWGYKEDNWLFPGTTVKRVMLGVRSDGSATALSGTFGWYSNTIGSLGLDVGGEAQMSGTRGYGPTARLTVGAKGLAVRMTGGAMFGDETRLTGAAELVLEVMDLGGTL